MSLTPIEINMIAEQTAAKVLAVLEAKGLMEPSYPERMNTRQVATLMGCTCKHVTENWRKWRLTLLGRGKAGQLQFQGLSVQRHIERQNA